MRRLVVALALLLLGGVAQAGGSQPLVPPMRLQLNGVTQPRKPILNLGPTFGLAGASNVYTLTLKHVLGGAGAPGLSTSSGAGTGPSVSLIFGTDTAGLIQLTTGTSPSAGSAAVIITYSQAFTGQGATILTPGNAAAAALTGTQQVFSDSAQNAAGSWRIMAGSAALAATTTYKWWYVVIQ